MAGLPEKLRLKGMAEEDIYFARRDRELIDALHHRERLERSKAKKEIADRAASPQSPSRPTAGVEHSGWLDRLVRFLRHGTGKTT